MRKLHRNQIAGLHLLTEKDVHSIKRLLDPLLPQVIYNDFKVHK